MAVSPGERRFMRRIGSYKAQTHARALAEHLALPLSERLSRSLELSVAGARGGARPARRDDPSALYARARALGLYRPRS